MITFFRNETGEAEESHEKLRVEGHGGVRNGYVPNPIHAWFSSDNTAATFSFVRVCVPMCNSI